MTTATPSAAFGASIKRREDPRLITGRGTYVDDIKMVGMLNIVLVRSPYAHANITSIDTSAASAVDGVVAVYTGEDLAEQLGSLPCGWVVPDTIEVPHPPLAIGKVRCVGDAVAAIVADSPYCCRRCRRSGGCRLRCTARSRERRIGDQGRRAAGP